MSAVLKHRRTSDEKDWCNSNDGCIEDGQYRKKRSIADAIADDKEDSGKSKYRGLKRPSSWKACALLATFFCICFIGQWRMPPTPKLPKLGVDIEVPDADDWSLIHIVQSRFMQEQGPLEVLGMARLKLFTTFCLPSMVQQSSQNFFWIIKTDPQFTTTAVFGSLVERVEPYDNIYLVASNENFVFGSSGRKGSWRDGEEALDLLQSKIYTGNTTKLKAAMALREEKPVLETRLDADDGLHKNFIQYIQDEALKRFRPNEPGGDDSLIPNWLYWCSRRHIEWHSDTDGSLSKEQEANVGTAELGYINMVQHDRICVTPGITIGYNTAVDNTIDVPIYAHDALYKNVIDSTSCYNNGKDDVNIVFDDSEADDETETRDRCLELIEDFLFCAIRSRTWTSAGMDKVDLPGVDGGYQHKEFTEKLWIVVEKAFAVSRTDVEKTQEFLFQHKKEIAKENLLGQCASGHSCKDSAKLKLRQIVDSNTTTD